MNINNSISTKVNFNLIRYANCWEDADILLKGLSLKAGSKILSIGSGGDNSFALLTTNPQMVVAIDINKTQLSLIELKKAAIKNLTYEETLKFLGFLPSSNRTEVFNKIKSEMSLSASSYWEANTNIIEKGIIYSGKFEKYFILFSSKILRWIHSGKKIESIFTKKTKEEQEIYYNQIWNSWKWKLLFKIFFSKYIMGKYGRDPKFLKEVNVPVAKTIYNKAAKHLQSIEAQQNFILHFCLKGNFGENLPFYMRKENFDFVKANVKKLILMEGLAQHAIDVHGKFNAMNLSNIFEYMDTDTFETTSKELLKGLEDKAKVCYWNLMVSRKISKTFPEEIEYQQKISKDLTDKDKGFFYSEFIVENKK